MSISRLLRSPRARRGIAASAIVLSLGGLVLFQAPAGADDPTYVDENYVNGTKFSGPGMRGTFSLSHGKVLADGRQPIYAELRMIADAADEAVERAPISMVIVLDTSGSMEGEKIEDARDSVKKIIGQMRPDDEVAFVRFDSSPELIQSMARVEDVRESLMYKVGAFQATGGTNIAGAMHMGMNALKGASAGRIKRVVVVGDGLDDSRAQSESIARNGTDAGATVSTLGIGLDFDEAYMAAVARAGRGNFGFVKDASTLASFLKRELDETGTTVVEQATARIQLPKHMRFKRVVGADVRQLGGGELELRMGSLFAGDERRVVIELDADAPLGADLPIDARVAWTPVGGDLASIDLERVRLVTTDSERAMRDSRDAKVWSSGVSATASLRQLEATEAYARGDGQRARELIDNNMRELDEAAAAAPPSVAQELRAQQSGYGDTKNKFDKAEPSSAEGRAAAKQSTEADNNNLSRPAWRKQ